MFNLVLESHYIRKHNKTSQKSHKKKQVLTQSLPFSYHTHLPATRNAGVESLSVCFLWPFSYCVVGLVQDVDLA